MIRPSAVRLNPTGSAAPGANDQAIGEVPPVAVS